MASDETAVIDIVWTAQEAMACAYCWSAFYAPEKTGFASPEAYWRNISPNARAACRRASEQRRMLLIARGSAVAIGPSSTFTDSERAAIGTYVGIKHHGRISKIIEAVWNVAAKRSTDYGQ